MSRCLIGLPQVRSEVHLDVSGGENPNLFFVDVFWVSRWPFSREWIGEVLELERIERILGQPSSWSFVEAMLFKLIH